MRRRAEEPVHYADAWHRGQHSELLDRRERALRWLRANVRKPRDRPPEIPPVLALPDIPAPGQILSAPELERYVERALAPQPIFRVL